MLRSVAAQKLQPAELLRQLNQLICERRIEARYMTMCFATWQKGRQKLRVANAGQSQPLLWKDGRCDRIDLSGFPLGLYEDVSYDETGFTLVQGDVLVFHSDGLAESSSPDGRHALALAARQGLDRLVDVLDRHQPEFVELLAGELRHPGAVGRAEPLPHDFGARGSRPRNMLSAIDKAGDNASV